MKETLDMVAWGNAIEHGDLLEAKVQLSLGADPNALLPTRSLTPLMLACSLGDVAMSQALIQAGASIDQARPETGITPLMAAVHGARQDMVRLLCQQGAQVNLLDRDGQSALMLAVASQQAGMVEVLLAHGADAALHGAQATPALVQAAVQGDAAMVALLLAALPNGKTPASGAALIEAADSGHLQVATVLLDHGAPIDRQDEQGHTPLMLAASMGHEAVVAMLLERGANPNCVNKVKANALEMNWHASATGTEAIAMRLLQAGLRVDHANNKQETALTHCIMAQNHRSTLHVLSQGVDVNLRDHKGATALHRAAARDDHTLVELLIEHGADVRAVDGQGRTPLHMAAEANQVDNARVLAAHGPIDTPTLLGASPLLVAAGHGCDEVAMALLERGANFQLATNEGSALHWAAMGGATKLARALIARGMRDRSVNSVGRTALHEAAAHNQPHVAIELIMAGSDPNAKTPEGRTVHDLGSQSFRDTLDAAIAQDQAKRLGRHTQPAGPNQSRRRI